MSKQAKRVVAALVAHDRVRVKNFRAYGIADILTVDRRREHMATELALSGLGLMLFSGDRNRADMLRNRWGIRKAHGMGRRFGSGINSGIVSATFAVRRMARAMERAGSSIAEIAQPLQVIEDVGEFTEQDYNYLMSRSNRGAQDEPMIDATRYVADMNGGAVGGGKSAMIERAAAESAARGESPLIVRYDDAQR